MASITPVQHELALLAHRLWCEEMLAQGWRPGPFDLDRRLHDAIIPFEDLSAVDRHSTVVGVVALELEDQLREVVEYPRGEFREFAASDLTVGMRVGFMDDPTPLGTVEDWEEDPAWPDCLRTVTVRWDSGEVNEYVAAERELRQMP